MKWLRRSGMPLAAFVGFLLFWEALIHLFKVPRFLVPAPSHVIETLFSELPELMPHFWVTMAESLASFVLGNGIAIVLAIWFLYSSTAERVVYPFAVAIRTVPIVAITPMLILLLGIGYAPKIAIAALISFFPTLVNMVQGLRSVEPAALELMRVLNASKWEVFVKLRWPSSMPFLFSALKIAATSSVLGAIVAEWINPNQGLGYLIILSTFQYRSGLLYATMTLASLAAVLFFAAIGLLERWLVPWRHVEAQDD